MESIHSARAYYLQVVVPQYEAALAVLIDSTIGMRRDTIAVANAALACLHLADHACRDPSIRGIPESPRTKAYIARLVSTDQVFEAVHDVANCFKHRTVTREGAVVRSLDDILERIAIVKYTDDLGDYYGALKVVSINGVHGPLSAIDLLRAAVVGWGKRLRDLKAIPAIPFIEPAPPLFRSRASLPADPTIELVHEVGEFIAHQPLPCVFDRSAGTVRDRRIGESFQTVLVMPWKTWSSRFDHGPRRIVDSGIARIDVAAAD